MITRQIAPAHRSRKTPGHSERLCRHLADILSRERRGPTSNDHCAQKLKAIEMVQHELSVLHIETQIECCETCQGLGHTGCLDCQERQRTLEMILEEEDLG